jgi:hypothetical protein
MDRRDVDALRPEFIRHILGDRSHADVAQRGNGAAGAIDRQATDIHDPSPAIGNQVWRERPRGAQIANHLDVDIFNGLRIVDFIEPGGR